MHEFNPLVLRRIMALRQFPMFATAELGELALLAENVAEASFAAGMPLAAPGKHPLALQLVVDGELACASGRDAHAWGAREVFGMLEALARRPLPAGAIATRPTRTLQLHTSDLGEILEDSFGVVRATMHELAARLAASLPEPGAHAIAMPSGDPLGLVDRLIVLRRLLPAASAHLDALAALAHASHEVTFPAGAILARAGDPANVCYVVVDGLLRVTSAEHPVITVSPGAALGALEAVGELPQRFTIEAITPVRVLETSATAIFDVIEDHPELGLAVLAGFATALLDR